MNVDDLTEQLEKLNIHVNDYHVSKLDGHRLAVLLQKITGILFYLETIRSEQHALFEANVFGLTQKGSSVARAVNEAHVNHPLMYRLRRIMDAGYRITDAIRTNISYLKSEKSNTNIQT